jgi:uncharacterized membrane protein HdeD (DUF308 family)
MYSGLPRNWRVLAARGVLAILFGLFALARPGMALPMLVLGFGVAVLLSGILAIVAGVRAEENQERSWPLVTEGVIAVAVGLIALLRPDAAARFWLFGVAGFVLVSGILHIFAAMKLRRDMRDELVLVINGALTATFGVMMILLPWAGLLVLGLLVGASSLCFGLLLVVVSLRLRTHWLARAA